MGVCVCVCLEYFFVLFKASIVTFTASIEGWTQTCCGSNSCCCCSWCWRWSMDRVAAVDRACKWSWVQRCSAIYSITSATVTAVYCLLTDLAPRRQKFLQLPWWWVSALLCACGFQVKMSVRQVPSLQCSDTASSAVEWGLVVGFCSQPHYCYRPFYLLFDNQVSISLVVLTCTNWVSPSHLPMPLASDRPWTRLSMRAH